MELTTKQEDFKNAFISGLAPIDAAREAYNKDGKINNNTLSQLAHDNLRLPKIKAAIDMHRAKISEKVENRAEDILRAVQALAYPAEGVVVQNNDRLRALELLGKNKAMWIDRRMGDGDGVQIFIEQPPRPVINEAKSIKSKKIEDEV